MTKVLAIGDPHGLIDRVKSIDLSGVDLIILTGDLGAAKKAREMAFANVAKRKAGALKDDAVKMGGVLVEKAGELKDGAKKRWDDWRESKREDK